MKISRFQEIIAWQKAKELNLLVYGKFRGCKDYYFRDQILRASLSIMNNIAEGFDRQSDKEFRQFLFISKGSCSEVKSMLYLALEFSHINTADFESMYDLSEETARLTHGLIKSLNLPD